VFAALLLFACRTAAPRPAEPAPASAVTPAPLPLVPPPPADAEARRGATLAQWAASDTVRACYERELSLDPVLVGRLTMRFTLGVNGTTSDISAEEDTLGSALVVRCLTAVIAQWVVSPPPPEPTEFVLPFVFSPNR
jgi:hypothetical protein